MVTKREETPEEFEARYQAMLKKYNIKPDNIALDKGGAASYYEDVKDDSRPAREERGMKSYKEYERTRTKEDETRKSGAVSKSKVEKKKSGSPQSTRRGQTSKGGSKVPPKNDWKKPPKKDEKKPPKNENKTPTISDSEQRSYHKPAMDQIADNKPPTHMKYYRGKDLSEVNPISTYIKNSAAKGRQQMEERSIKRRADVSKYSSQSTSKETKSKETKKKQGKVLKEVTTRVTNDDIRLGRSPLTIQAQQTKKKSPLDIILDKEKKKFKYKQ